MEIRKFHISLDEKLNLQECVSCWPLLRKPLTREARKSRWEEEEEVEARFRLCKRG